VEGLLDLQELPAHVLAILGARGDRRSLDALTRHLNDDRAGVRRWVLNAFQETLGNVNRALAVERLKQALDGATRAETREAVRDLLRRLEKP
jgi:HEAT repeat protein